MNRTSRLIVFPAIVLLSLISGIPASAQLLQADVSAKSNLFYAGRWTDYLSPNRPTTGCKTYGAGITYLGDGQYPPHIALSPGTRSIQTYSYTTAPFSYGTASGNIYSADGKTQGIAAGIKTSTDPTGALTGLKFANRVGILSAVFLDDNEPVKTGIMVTNTYTVVDLNAPNPAYALKQAFFMGDGLVADNPDSISMPTSTQQRQSFTVPAGATRLFLGFGDSNGTTGTNTGSNTCYTDNTGVVFTKIMMSVSDDEGTVQAGVGGTAISDVRQNDYLDSMVTPAAPRAALTQQGTWPTGITLDVATGRVTVAPSVVAGDYDNLFYELCDTTTTPAASCSQAKALVHVKNGPLSAVLAVNDSGTATAGTASTPIADVRTNDTIGTAPATAANSTIAPQGVWPAGIALNTATGAVSIDTSVAANHYTMSYILCELSNPGNCATGTVTLSVVSNPLMLAQLVLMDDAGSTQQGTAATVVADVRSNDTVDSAPMTAANADLFYAHAWPAGITLNPSTGAVDVAASVPAGLYVLQYQACEKNVPGNCAYARVGITVAVNAQPASSIPVFGPWGILLSMLMLTGAAFFHRKPQY